MSDVSGIEGKTRTMSRTGDLRQIICMQGPQTLGPMLQEAWICHEDGSVEWRRVPIVVVSIKDYLDATK